MNDELNKRSKVLNATIMSVFFCMVVFISYISVFTETPWVGKSNVYEGAFFSSDGILLTEIKEKDSTLTAEEQRSRYLIYPEQYSPILGYNSSYYSSTGLRERYQSWLYDGKKDQSGKSLTLTINHELQVECFSLLNEFQQDGSIVVIDNKTGKILVLVSTKETENFNANQIDEMNFDNLPDSYLTPEWEIAAKPGSSFKAVIGIAMLSSLGEYAFYDEKGYVNVGDAQIYNAGHTAYGQLDLPKAIKVSSNTFFVSAFLENESLYDSVKTVCEYFKIGEEIELDICELTSDFIYSEDKFARALTMFGQGDIYITPIHNCMIFSAIASGQLMKPYVVLTNTDRSWLDNLFNRNEFVEPVVLEKNIIKGAESIRDALSLAAESYGFEEVIAKTGTAELTDDGSLYQYWLCAANSDFSVCISTTGEYGYSSDLIEPMGEIIELVKSKYEQQ